MSALAVKIHRAAAGDGVEHRAAAHGSGSAARSRAGRSASGVGGMLVNWKRACRSVTIAPLGVPVEPDEWMSRAIRSGSSTGGERRPRPVRAGRHEIVDRDQLGRAHRPAGPAPCPSASRSASTRRSRSKATTVCTVGCREASSAAATRSAAVAAITTGSVSTMIRSRSWPASEVCRRHVHRLCQRARQIEGHVVGAREPEDGDGLTRLDAAALVVLPHRRHRPYPALELA